MPVFADGFVSDLVAVVFDAVIAHDGTEIVDANERAARIFGFEHREDLIGAPVSNLMADKERPAAEQRIRKRTEGRYSARCRRSDGREFTADINAREVTVEGARLRLLALRYSSEHRDALGEALIHRSLALDQTVESLASTIEQRDVFTAGHQTRVSSLATEVAHDLGMSSREITTIRIAGNIHDIGKIAVPAEILMKPGSLSDQEYALIKIHPSTGAAIINSVDFDGPVRDIVLQHHERLDGSGYPAGTTNPIPEARVIAVADVYDAMTSSRPYRAGMSPDAALRLMNEQETDRLDAEAMKALSRVA
ncbi:MAG TPA: HD domain-containing phosphohydrolase, partial [Arenicellales bacterium]|nr:HD domain-containing phosphohydrolase [Arenicellales bacterium]